MTYPRAGDDVKLDDNVDVGRSLKCIRTTTTPRKNIFLNKSFIYLFFVFISRLKVRTF